jgi:hypothetical protein
VIESARLLRIGRQTHMHECAYTFCLTTPPGDSISKKAIIRDSPSVCTSKTMSKNKLLSLNSPSLWIFVIDNRKLTHIPHLKQIFVTF